MDDKYSIQEKQTRHLQQWLYLLPIVGIIPAIWTLFARQSEPKQKQASRLSIALLITWFSLYLSLSLGADTTSDILAFRLLYANALITTGYFVTCLILMLRLNPQNPFYFSWLGKNIERIIGKDRSQKRSN